MAEPLESWAIHAVNVMGALKPESFRQRIWHRLQIYDLPNRRHVIPRLTNARVKSLIERVLANAEAANSDRDSEFTFDTISLFGSVLHGANAPGDVDIAFVARFRDTEEIIPEPDYYPFSRNRPDDRAAVVLRGGVRRMDLSIHDLREVQAIGSAYKVIWTCEEGRVNRPVLPAIRAAPDPMDEGEDGILRTNTKCDSFREACLNSSPLPPPILPQIPDGTRSMTFKQWVEALNAEALVCLLAHHYCLPDGAVKHCAEELISELRELNSEKVVEAEGELFPFLAASLEFGTWKWHTELGLLEGKPYPARLLSSY